MNENDPKNTDVTRSYIDTRQAAGIRTHTAGDRLAPSPATRSPWRWLLFAGLIVVFALVGVIWFWPKPTIQQAPGPVDELEAAIAAADRLDPGWRWNELDAKRAEVPDIQNGAKVVAVVSEFLGSNNRPPEFGSLEGGVRLTNAQRVELSIWLQAQPDALRIARTLPEYPHGRNKLEIPKNPINILLQHTQNARGVAALLDAEALRRAEEGEPTLLQEFQAIVHVSRAIGDEPFLVSQLVRAAITSMAIRNLERTLGRATTADSALAMAQRLLDEVNRFPGMLIARRGERAINFLLYERIDASQITRDELSADFRNMGRKEEWPANLGPGTPELRAVRAQELRMATQMVEVAKKPIAEQVAAIQKLDFSNLKKTPLDDLSELLDKNKLSSQFEGDGRRQAMVRSALVAVAAERHRLRHGRWPVEVKEIDADFASALPTDPYDNSPLRLRRLEDGLVVYSIGPNGRDDGGDLKGGVSLSPDVGFRLWDAPRRK